MEIKALPGHPGYSVNERGDIIRPTGTVFKNNKRKRYYATVCIEKKTYNAHVLICTAWHGEPTHKNFVVWHMDGYKGNNHPNNIRWFPRKVVETLYKDAGISKRKEGDKHHSTKLSASKKAVIRFVLRKGAPVALVAKEFKVSLTTIYKLKNQTKNGNK